MIICYENLKSRFKSALVQSLEVIHEGNKTRFNDSIISLNRIQPRILLLQNVLFYHPLLYLFALRLNS